MKGVAGIRTVEHESDGLSWRMTVGIPASVLAQDITRLHAYFENGAPLARRELPSGQATLVFNLGADLGVTFPGESLQRFGTGGAFFSGPGNRYAVTDTWSGQEGAQVMLTALGARRLLGLPLEEVGDRLISPADLFGPAARDLGDALQEANSQDRRVAILAAAIADRIAEAAPVSGDLGWALDRLTHTKGRSSVSGLAAEIGCSRKHLTSRFRREFGMAPKGFARVLRFNAAINALRGGRITSWAALAADLGYSDQSHLSRDFVAFAGAPPSAFAARMIHGEGGFLD